MNLRDSISINLRMTKHLFQASPNYFLINLLRTLWNTFAFIFRTLFYKYIIDAIVYLESRLEHIAVLFLAYTLISIIDAIINDWVGIYFHERQKIKIEKYYKEFICRESAEKSLENTNSARYMDLLHDAVYNDGNYLYSFSINLFGLAGDVFTLLFFFSVFVSLHPFFIVIAVISAIKNLLCEDKTNKVQFQKYNRTLSYDRSDRGLFNLFYLKQYVREMRVYPIGEYFIEKYKALQHAWWSDSKKYNYKEMFITTFRELLDFMIYLVNIAVLVYFLLHKSITVGDFNLILSNFIIAVGNIQRVLMFLPNVSNDARYMNNVASVIDSENHTFPEVVCDKGQAKVRFENVSYSYDSNTMVLENINLELPLDKKIAILGENGAGKSTFIKLITGLYKPTSGKIEYFYHDAAIKNSSMLFSTLFQDYQIYSLSVAENILPNEVLDEENMKKIEDALQFSELKEKIDALPDGADTVLTGEFSEDGVYLSGGEQQKLAIARAYAMDRPVMILDEPSSNLDPIAENQLIDKINRLTDNKAVILITHNPFYAKNVDLILIFRQGRLVEYGSPEKLMKQDGYYKKMLAERTKMDL